MIRTSLAAGVGVAALALCAAGLAQPLSAHVRPSDEPALLPPNHVGTWRLDSLLDQASVSGVAPSDVDPSVFVLHDLRFDHGTGDLQVLQSPFGEGSVEAGDGCVRLTAKGRAAAFRIALPRNDAGEFTKDEEFGMVAVHLRSSDAGEVALLRGDSMFGGPGGNLNLGGPLPLPNLGNFVLPNAPAGGPPPPNANGTPKPPAPPPPPGGVPAGAPGPGGPGGPGGVQLDFDPRTLLGANVAKFAADGDWHAVARAKSQLQVAGMMGGMMGGPRNGAGALEQVTLVVLPPADKVKTGVTVDLDFLHVLDAKADYASHPAAACSIVRSGVTYGGMYMNTPCEASWRLVAPENGRLIAGLSALDSKPFDLFVHVTAGGARKTLLQRTHEAGTEIGSIDVDLSAYAGKEITLTLEAVEAEQPTVAFLLQPLVYGKRKDGVKNVFLYFCDTTRADALSCYGNERPTTPNLDAIAADGIRFERCFSQGAWTYVSMPASLSGMFPSVNGVKSGGERIADSVVTMAEAFRNAGYLTAAFIRNDFVGVQTNTAQGFDFFFPGDTVLEAGQAPAQRGLQQVVGRMLGRNNDAALLGNGGNIFQSGSSRDLYAKAEPWVEKYADVPFFLYLHAVDPHDPYDPEKADMNRFLTDEEKKRFDDEETKVSTQMTRAIGQGLAVVGAGGAPAPAPAPAQNPAAAPTNSPTANGPAATPGASTTAAAAQTAPAPTSAPKPAPTVPPVAPRPVIADNVREQLKQAGIDPDAHIARARALYDAEVLYFDRHMERMVDLMKSKGLWNDLVFLFNADHGEEFLDHNNTGHGQSVYAELDHVPWILHAPGLPKGKVIQDSVMNLDLAPTLLGLCGAEIPDTMQGRDLVDALKAGEEIPAAPIFTERWGGGIQMFAGGGNGDLTDDPGEEHFLGQWAVIEGHWKTVVTRSLAHELGPDGKPKVGPDDKPLPPSVKVDLDIYDLDHDLKDAHTLIADERPRAEAAAKRLETWLREMKKLNGRYANENTTNENATAALRALGYAQ